MGQDVVDVPGCQALGQLAQAPGPMYWDFAPLLFDIRLSLALVCPALVCCSSPSPSQSLSPFPIVVSAMVVERSVRWSQHCLFTAV